MVAYSFKRQFVEPILAGTKRQTIRADRKRHARPGEQMQLYTGMRTKHCKRIGWAYCRDAGPILLRFFGNNQGVFLPDGRMGHATTEGGRDSFARDDGFSNWIELREFWRDVHGVTDDEWSGVLIRWMGFWT